MQVLSDTESRAPNPMLMLISPAKTLDYESPLPTNKFSEPELLADSAKLMREVKQLAPQDLAGLMGISDKLADLNYRRNQQWKKPFTPDNARPAVLAFKGDVYLGLEAENFSGHDFNFAQKHLRILSGLYGVLRPLDLMQPYRLEMGTKLKNKGGDNLYQFWGDRIAKNLNAQLAALKSDTVVNLASNEYFSAVDTKVLKAQVITPAFKEIKDGKARVLSFFAKKARGRMAAWAIQNRITSADELRNFDVDGYRFDAALSTDSNWVFTRKQPPPAGQSR